MFPDSLNIDSVLLIDGDNDPHLPPGTALSERDLVRVFLRPGARIPAGLARRLAGSNPIMVQSQEGGKNAADFVMALHAGLLHGALPVSVPFVLVTADKKLGAIIEELRRIGRRATLWTSHPERGEAAVERAAKRYVLRVTRLKDPPRSVGAMLDDIESSLTESGVSARDVFERLKSHHGFVVGGGGGGAASAAPAPAKKRRRRRRR